jgi:acetyltransferase
MNKTDTDRIQTVAIADTGGLHTAHMPTSTPDRACVEEPMMLRDAVSRLSAMWTIGSGLLQALRFAPQRAPAPASDGVQMRAATAHDLAGVRRLFDNLSLRSRYQRFFVPLRELPADLVDALLRRDPRHRCVVAESASAIVGLGEYATDTTGACEIALVVADDWQGRGVGARLLAYVLDGAARAGVPEANLTTRIDNRAMRRLASRFDFVFARDPDDATLVAGHRMLGA